VSFRGKFKTLASSDFYDPERIYSRTITNGASDMRALLEDAEAFCGRWSDDARKKYNTVMAVEEISAVIIDQAFKSGPGEYIIISLIAMENGDFHLHVRDNANFFNPLAIASRKIQSENESDLDGLGILMIKSVARELFYRRYRGFNTLMICI
jgi:anti-sigma regulatory factor (Ser/Thr protein kinase)